MIPDCYITGCTRQADGGEIRTYAEVPEGMMNADGNPIGMFKTVFCKILVCREHHAAIQGAC